MYRKNNLILQFNSRQVHYWNVLEFKIPWIAIKFIEQYHDYLLIMGNVYRMAHDYNKVKYIIL